MNRLITATTVVLVLLTMTAALAQTPAQPQNAHPTGIAQPNAEQKAQIAALAKVWDQKAREADAARDKYMIQLLATLAELGLKPSETAVTWNEKGEPVFTHIDPKPAPTPTPALTPKPEAKNP
nr:hypothetical protein [uncultured bacterium]